MNLFNYLTNHNLYREEALTLEEAAELVAENGNYEYGTEAMWIVGGVENTTLLFTECFPEEGDE